MALGAGGFSGYALFAVGVAWGASCIVCAGEVIAF